MIDHRIEFSNLSNWKEERYKTNSGDKHIKPQKYNSYELFGKLFIL